MTDRRVAVIGGGISGLSAAMALLDAGAEVTVFEAAETLGGKIASTVVDGIQLPTAPDAFLARQPEMIDLAHELGLGEHLVSPAAREARIARGGELHPLPPNLLGIPTDLAALQDSALISAAGVARAAEDLDAEDDRPEGDEAVGALVRRRLGDEVLEYLVDPLLGGINAGDSDRLSADAGVPQVGAAKAIDPSLIEAVRAMKSRGNPDPDAPVFLTPHGGLQLMIDALEDRIATHGTLRLATRVEVAPTDHGWLVGGDPFDRVVVATAAAPAAALLRPIAPRASAGLDAIETSSVAMCLLVLPSGSVPLEDTVSGVLVPRLEGRTVTAVSIATNKWPHLADDRVVLRVSVGRRTHTRWMERSDEELIADVRHDLRDLIGVHAEPIATHITRWMDALPQYDVGHATRIDTIEAALEDEATGVHLAGPMLRGLGLPACVRSGRAAAASALR